MSEISLIPIQRDGTVEIDGDLSWEPVRTVLSMTKQMYDEVGFSPPWGGYLAVCDSEVVGSCGFKSPPQNGSVEIAYFTFLDHEGQGIGTRMAELLLDRAAARDSNVVVTAQTLLQRSASHRILEKLDFIAGATIQHPEDGPVMVWRRNQQTPPR